MNGMEALAHATHLLSAYCHAAEANLKRSDKGWLLRTLNREPFTPIDCKALREALTIKNEHGPEHLVVMRYGEHGEAKPQGLQLLFDVHTAIYYVNGALLLLHKKPLKKAESQTVRRKWIEIYAGAAFLSEFFRHAATVVSTPGARAALNHRIGLTPQHPPTAEDGAQLAALNQAHRDRLLTMVLRISRKPYRAASAIAERLGRYAPVDLPGVITWREHDGARVINDTWFPAQYANPMMQRIAMEQAAALSGQSR